MAQQAGIAGLILKSVQRISDVINFTDQKAESATIEAVDMANAFVIAFVHGGMSWGGNGAGYSCNAEITSPTVLTWGKYGDNLGLNHNMPTGADVYEISGHKSIQAASVPINTGDDEVFDVTINEVNPDKCILIMNFVTIGSVRAWSVTPSLTSGTNLRFSVDHLMDPYNENLKPLCYIIELK